MLTYFGRPQSNSRHQNTKIKQIPHFVNPQKISQLNFSYNDIRFIPQHIVSLFNLQIIDLSHNKISKIENIYHIRTLKLLNLSHNLISYIPQDISLLEEIQNIDLSYNKIAMINNIKILKEFIEMRMIVREDFVQINLEGNEVLKKKGCRQLYKKWMNPNYSDCNRYSQAKIKVKEHEINLTKKRNSKSLQYTHTFRNHNNSSILQTNRTFKVVHNPTPQDNYHSELKKNMLDATEKININNIKSQQFSNQKQQLPSQLVSFKSEILKRQQCVNYLSQMQQDLGCNEAGDIGEWFYLCIDRLTNLKEGFILISQNEDIKCFDEQIKSKLIQQCNYARQLVNISLDIIRLTIDNNLNKQAFQEYLGLIQIINQKIKKFHHQILRKFQEKDHLPIKIYKPWVIYVKKLKLIIKMLPLKIAYHQAHHARQQQLKQLSSISPQKDIISHSQTQQANEINSNKKTGLNKGKLNQLLFSKNKDELLLSMQKPNKSQQTNKQLIDQRQKGYQQCDYCLMLKWQNNKNKLQIVDLQQKLKIYVKQKQGYLQKIQSLQKFKEKYLNLICKQQLIIEQLQDLRPSTYQNILLQQAKTIQYMLSAQSTMPLNMKNKAIAYPTQKYMIQSYNSRQLKGKLISSNTNLSSTLVNKDKIMQGKIVSEFSIEGKNELITKESNNRSSYFKNKNIITTINRSIDGKSKEDDANRYESTQKRQQIIVSQFNTQVNHSIYQTQSNDQYNNKDKDKKSLIKQKNIDMNNINDMHSMHYSINSINSEVLKNQKVPTKLAKRQNQRLLISETSSNKKNSVKMLQIAKNRQQQQQIRLQLLSKLLTAKLNTQKSAVSSKHIQSKHSISKKNISNRSSSNKHNSTNRNLSSYQSKQNNSQNLTTTYLNNNKSYDLLRQRNDNFNQIHRYVPMPSNQTENYKKYMKYHLRNNIIQVLTKKNNYMPQYNQYKYLTNSHQVINKSNIHKKQSYKQSADYSAIKTLR